MKSEEITYDMVAEICRAIEDLKHKQTLISVITEHPHVIAIILAVLVPNLTPNSPDYMSYYELVSYWYYKWLFQDCSGY